MRIVRSLSPLSCARSDVAPSHARASASTVHASTCHHTHASVGARVDVEVTVEYRRHRIPATIVETPFYNPARKRA